jgi:hypothetical protein
MAEQFRLSDQSMIGFVATSDPDRAKKFYCDILALPLYPSNCRLLWFLTLTAQCCE